MKYLYFVATLEIGKKGKLKDSRCVGIFQKFKDASDIPDNNIGDVYENSYNYIVIEQISIDELYPHLISQVFYRYDSYSHSYKVIDKNPDKDADDIGDIFIYSLS
jgi:hypothetical protein